ncbi:tape measure protein [Stutzerimonas nitrititolerans]|uniref:tape measure protein n=1 Tax=Stutzerimonas nitrititolerans TaxID=2482751 RepID=UPI002647CB7C|nr:tape measure protein [Stutzerimonas nitrititolerans]
MTDVELRLTADVDQATKSVGGFRKQYAELVKAIEKPLRQVNAFRELETSLENTEREARAARDRVRDLGNELARTATPSKVLTASYRDAVNELRRLERSEAGAQTQLARRRREMQAAGIDTRNLASEQQRLSRELDAAQAGGRNDLAVSGIRARAAALAQVTREQRLANLESARADLGVNRYRALQAELTQTRRNYELLRRSGNLTGRELAVAQQTMTRRVHETRAAIKSLEVDQRRMRATGAAALVMTGGVVGGAYAAVRAVQGIAAITDAYTLMNARLKLATSSQEEFNAAQAGLEGIARRTETPVASLVTLYGRISRPLKEAGRSQTEILQVTEAVATSFRVSGASATEAENGVIQFAQALGAGALRGDEFNSVAEQAPRLMQALADGIGVPVGALKEMAAQGQLTSDIVTDALTSQLDVLRKEAETLPDTVGGAMTDLTDRWNKAIGEADVGKLIDAIGELADTVSDPQIVKGLTDIATAMATLAGWTITAASEFTVFADKVAFTAAQLSTGTGETAEQVRELEKLKRALSEVNAARSGSSFFGSATVPLLMKFFAPEKLDEWAAELETKIKAFEEKLYGIAQGEVAQESQLSEELQSNRDEELASRRRYITEVEAQQARLVKAAETAGKQLAAAEKKATQDLEKVRADRLKIEERYQEALAGMNGGGTASYGAAQSLKVAARQALQAGDIEGAKAQAQAALKMLQELQDAGESTYGFAGFIGELRDIELAANDIEQTNAEQKIEAIKAEMIDLKAKAAALEDMPVSVKMDDAALEQVKQALSALANTKVMVQVGAQYDFTQPYTLQDPGPVPAFATGGILRGPGTGTSDSILARLSNGEGILTARAVRYFGPEVVHQLNRLQLPKFAEGGVLNMPPRFVPNVPAPSQALLDAAAGPSMPHLGSVDFNLGGESFQVFVNQSQVDPLRLAARKFGRTHRNG